MAFFNQKEEVIDIKLTQFGKNSLARGVFKPVFYRFFDDDILYDASRAGITEHQNDTEIRILEQTPRLKTQHLFYGVEETYLNDDQKIIDREKSRFEKLEKNVKLELQERILKYPIGNQDISDQRNPGFSVEFHDAKLVTTSENFSLLNSDGINRNIPQLDLEPKYEIIMSHKEQVESERITDEDHYDLTSDLVLFNSGTEFKINKQNIIIDIQEIATFYGLENFEVEIFEVQENEETKNLLKINSLEDLRKKFVIKTDEDVDLSSKKSFKQTNFRRSDEY